MKKGTFLPSPEGIFLLWGESIAIAIDFEDLSLERMGLEFWDGLGTTLVLCFGEEFIVEEIVLCTIGINDSRAICVVELTVLVPSLVAIGIGDCRSIYPVQLSILVVPNCPILIRNNLRSHDFLLVCHFVGQLSLALCSLCGYF